MRYFYNHMEDQVQCHNFCVPWIPELEHDEARITDPWLVAHCCFLSFYLHLYSTVRGTSCIWTLSLQSKLLPHPFNQQLSAIPQGHQSPHIACDLPLEVWSPGLTQLPRGHVVLEGERGGKGLVFRMDHYRRRHIQGFWTMTLILLWHPTGPALCVGVCAVNHVLSGKIQTWTLIFSFFYWDIIDIQPCISLKCTV